MSHTSLADNKHRAYGPKYWMFMKTESSVFKTMQSFWGHECSFRTDLHPCYSGVWITNNGNSEKVYLWADLFLNKLQYFFLISSSKAAGMAIGPVQYCVSPAVTEFVDLGPETLPPSKIKPQKKALWLIFNKMFGLFLDFLFSPLTLRCTHHVKRRFLLSIQPQSY